MRSDAVADSGVYAPRHFCNSRVRVQVDKIQRSLSTAGGEGVGNSLAHPSAPTVDCGLVCTCEASPHNLVDILDTLRAADVALGRVWSEPPTLNDVFLEITGRELRD